MDSSGVSTQAALLPCRQCLSLYLVCDALSMASWHDPKAGDALGPISRHCLHFQLAERGKKKRSQAPDLTVIL